MANFVFNIAKGRVMEMGSYGYMRGGTFRITPLKAAGLESDAAMQDRTTMTTVLANNQLHGSMGVKTLTGIDPYLSHANDRHELRADDVVWSAATGDPVGKMIISYKPPAGDGYGTADIPVVALDLSYTPNGNDLQLGFPSSGFYQAL